MRILAIETATGASSVALVEGRLVAASASRLGRTGHDGFLIPAIDFCFEQAGWGPEQLDVVVVDAGPGLFTGIRVGIATGQGVAAMLGVPIMAASSLDALALRAATGRRHIWSVVDARRREVAVAGYRPVPGERSWTRLPSWSATSTSGGSSNRIRTMCWWSETSRCCPRPLCGASIA